MSTKQTASKRPKAILSALSSSGARERLHDDAKGFASDLTTIVKEILPMYRPSDELDLDDPVVHGYIASAALSIAAVGDPLVEKVFEQANLDPKNPLSWGYCSTGSVGSTSARRRNEARQKNRIPDDIVNCCAILIVNAEIQAFLKAFEDHLLDVERVFNAQSDIGGLGVHLDVSDLVNQTRRGRNYRSILSFFSADRPGVLYREQILTAVDAIVSIIESPYNLGLILGALQSGKTTTALALQFAGPAIYLVTNQKIFPFYLTTCQNSHEEQFCNELSLHQILWWH